MSKEKAKVRKLRIITKHINAWNPFDILYPDEMDSDEFKSECIAILKQLPRVKTKNDLTEAISRTFKSSFWPSSRFSHDNCSTAGEFIFNELRS